MLFINIHQIFSFFFLPIYKANVHLTSVLHLIQIPSPDHQGYDNAEGGKWYIMHQEDLYQTDEVVKFFWPGGNWVLWAFQLFATGMCILGALSLAPVTWMMQRRSVKVNGVKRI
jgi:hypothetical protein